MNLPNSNELHKTEHKLGTQYQFYSTSKETEHVPLISTATVPECGPKKVFQNSQRIVLDSLECVD